MKANRTNPRNKLIQRFLVAVLGSGLLLFLFSAAGPFVRWWNTDLGFLLIPLITLLLLLVASSVIPLVFDSLHAYLYSILLKYAALACFTYLIFLRAILFSRLPFLAQQLDTLNTLQGSALYLALFWMGAGIYQVSSLLPPRKLSDPGYPPLLNMLSFSIIGFSFWKTLDLWSLQWASLKGLGFVIGLSLIIVGLTRLTAYITTPLTFWIGDALKWCLKYPVKLFWLSILILLYFVIARPRIFAISAYAYLIEWILICFLGYHILSLVKNSLKISYARSPLETIWRKHQQIVNNIPDDDFNRMVVLQEEFIQTGLRRQLLLFLKQLLVNNGIPESGASRLLQPIIEYNDVKARWYYRWFFKKRLIQGNRYRRIQVLEDSMDNIRGAIYPAHKYTDGVINERNPIS